jgi:hypothetical protein
MGSSVRQVTDTTGALRAYSRLGICPSSPYRPQYQLPILLDDATGDADLQPERPGGSSISLVRRVMLQLLDVASKGDCG